MPAPRDPEIRPRRTSVVMAGGSPGVTIVQLTREKEALLTPIALMLVAVATVGATGSALPFHTEGLFRTDFITTPLKPREDDAAFP